MKRNIKNIERELVHQILICELCFDVCNSMEKIPGRGNDFLPFYYNLNFSKGIISLHSLLLSNEKNELSIKNYIDEHKFNFPKDDISDLKKKINSISEIFKNLFPINLRHKIAAHIDEGFVHKDFTCAYITPHLIPKYKQIILELQNTLFKHCHYDKNTYKPLHKIKEQSDLILKTFLDSEDKT